MKCLALILLVPFIAVAIPGNTRAGTPVGRLSAKTTAATWNSDNRPANASAISYPLRPLQEQRKRRNRHETECDGLQATDSTTL